MMEQPPPSTAGTLRTTKLARTLVPRTTPPHQPQRYPSNSNVILTLGKEYGASRLGFSGEALEECPGTTDSKEKCPGTTCLNAAVASWFLHGNSLFDRVRTIS